MSGSHGDVDSTSNDRAEESDSTYQKIQSPSRVKQEHQRNYELLDSNDTREQP
jgi:hypothetical protein